MATVPRYDNLQTSVNPGGGGRFSVPSIPGAGAIAADQMQRQGQALTQAGGQAARIMIDAQQEANQLRVVDALSQVKEAAYDLQYGATGYSNLKGEGALSSNDGKSLAQRAVENLDERVNSISATLGNDAQRVEFQRSYANYRNSFREEAQRYTLQQQQVYTESKLKGYVANSIREGAANPTSIEPGGLIERNLTGIEGATRQLYRTQGLSQEEADSAVLQWQSKMLLGVVSQNVESNNLPMASRVLQKYKDWMDPDSYLKGISAVRDQQDAVIALDVGQAVSTHFSSSVDPTSWDRVEWAVAQQESGGRDYNPDGSVVTSSKGAKGRMQVMDATARNPGFGVKPAKDESLEESNRVGRELLPALFRHYGDLPKALAAYNAGSGSVNDAVKKAEKAGNPDAWPSYLPKETQNYVPAVQARIANGAGPAPATKRDYADYAEQRAIRSGASPKGVQQAVQAAEKQYELDMSARKSRDEEAEANVKRALIQNGGVFSALSQDLKDSLPADKYDDAMAFSKRVQEGGQVVNRPEVWAQVATMSPAELAGFTPTQFYNQYAGSLDAAHLEKGYALINAAQGSGDQKHLNIVSTTERMTRAAKDAGILPWVGKANKTESEAFSRFEKTVEAKVRQFESVDLQGKRQATGEELQKILDGTVMDTVRISNPMWMDGTTLASQATPDQLREAYVTVGNEDIKLASIPAGQRADIVEALQKRGQPITEQAIASLWVRAGKPK